MATATDRGIGVAVMLTEWTPAFLWIVKKIKTHTPFLEYVFSKDGKRLTAQSMRMRHKRNCAKLNIRYRSPHKIRKTYGSILLDNHVDNKLIMGQMGHTDILCTENYYHRNRRSIDEKSKIISEIPEFKKEKDNRTYV